MTIEILEKPRTFEEELKWRLDNLEYQKTRGLDTGLYDVLVSMHNRGIFTYFSCAGHRQGARGYIRICSHEIKGKNREDLLLILMRHGLKDIEIITNDKDTTGVEFAAIEGSQYRCDDVFPILEDADYIDYIPTKPDKCETCGGAKVWIQGIYYVTDSTVEWMCQNCQPLSFETNNREIETPEIKKRRSELPVLKLWEVKKDEVSFPFQILAATAADIYDELGLDEFDDDNYLNIKRL